MKLRLHRLLAFMASLVVLAPVSADSIITWLGSVPSNLLDNSNWSGGLNPGTDVVFGPANDAQFITVPLSLELGSIEFDSSSFRAAYTFSGTGSPILTLNGNVTVESGGDITFNNTLGLSLTAATHTIDIAGSSTAVYVRSNITETSSSASIHKTGDGTLHLTGNNSFSGNLTADDGFVVLGSASARGTGNLIFSGDAFLRAASANSIEGGSHVFSGNSTLQIETADALVGGLITLKGEAALRIGALNAISGTDLYFSGYEGGTGGNLVLNGRDTTVGYISSGVAAGAGLIVNDGETDASLTIDFDETSKTFDGRIQDTSSESVPLGEIASPTLALVKAGSGTLSLTGENTYSGGTTIEGGALVIANDGNLGTVPGSPTPGHLTLNGGTLQVTSSFELHANRSISLGANGGTLSPDAGQTLTFAGTISSDNSSMSVLHKRGDGTLELTGTVPSNLKHLVIWTGTVALAEENTLSNGVDITIGPSVANGSTLSVRENQRIRGLSGYGTVSIEDEMAFTVDLPGSPHAVVSTFNGGFVGSSSSSLVKAGPSTLTLAGASLTFSGAIVVDSGTLAIATAGALGDTSGGTTVNPSGTLELQNVSIGAEPLSLTGTGALSATGNSSFSGAITLAGGTTIGTPNSTDTLTITGSIGESGGVRQLTKNGVGTLVLAGTTSTYTGVTQVNGGTLKIGATDALPTSTAVGLSEHTLLWIDADQTISRFLGSISALSEIRLADEHTLTVRTPSNSNGGPGLFAGLISGDGALAIEGVTSGINATTLTLTGATNSYTGGTILRSGTLDFVAGALGTGEIEMQGGILRWHHGNTADLSAHIQMANAKTATFDTNGNDVVFAQAIGGATSAALQKSGHGSLTLSGSNTYTGTTTVTGGTLLIAHASALGSATVSVSGLSSMASRFGGIGGIDGNLILNAHGGVSPGSGETIGKLTVGGATFEENAFFDFKIRSVTGTPGTDWGLLEISGTLVFNATTSNPFTIHIDGVGGIDENTSLTLPHQWMFVTASNITGFDANAFSIDGPTEFGSFFVTSSSNNLFINFTPAAVPEPSTWALLITGLAVIAFTVRRPKK